MEEEASKDAVRQFFDEQYRLHRDELCRLARRHMDSRLLKRLTPEDIVHAMFERAIETPAYYMTERSLPTGYKWKTALFHELLTAARTHIKVQKRTVCDEMYPDRATPTLLFRPLLSNEKTPSCFAARADRSQLLMSKLNELPEDERAMIEMRQMWGLTVPQCAKALNIPERDVTNRYLRAVRHLRRRLLRCSEFGGR